VMGLQGVELILIGYNTPIHYPPDPGQDRLAGFHNHLVMQAGAYQNGTWVVGVAKGVDRDAGKEEFHRVGQRAFALRHNDPVLYFVQRLRDEAHRFAIGTHRAKRAKAIGATPLDEVPGVGATRKRALLAHFGSAKAVARADLPDLKAVDGISVALAETIYDFFHDKG